MLERRIGRDPFAGQCQWPDGRPSGGSEDDESRAVGRQRKSGGRATVVANGKRQDSPGTRAPDPTARPGRFFTRKRQSASAQVIWLVAHEEEVAPRPVPAVDEVKLDRHAALRNGKILWHVEDGSGRPPLAHPRRFCPCRTAARRPDRRRNLPHIGAAKSPTRLSHVGKSFRLAAWRRFRPRDRRSLAGKSLNPLQDVKVHVRPISEDKYFVTHPSGRTSLPFSVVMRVRSTSEFVVSKSYPAGMPISAAALFSGAKLKPCSPW